MEDEPGVRGPTPRGNRAPLACGCSREAWFYMVMICPSCGAENPDHADFCNLCHSKVGFEDPEYCGPPAFDEGYGNSYPSSFREDAPVPKPDDFTRLPDAAPVDIGRYGTSSGERFSEDAAPRAADAPAQPVEIGQYGERSGHQEGEPGPEQFYYDSQHGKEDRKRKLRRKKQ